VLIDFTGPGSKQFQKITSELWFRGSLAKQSQTFAIVLDTVIESTPRSSTRYVAQKRHQRRGGDKRR